MQNCSDSMAVAGINNVSVLESSYFADNYSRKWGSQEKPITRTSFIRKLWRDLEDGCKIPDTERKHTSRMASSNFRSHCSCPSEGGESDVMSINTSEVENQYPWDQNQIRNEQEDNQSLCTRHSPVIGLADKERVRQVFREWRSKSNNGRVSNASLSHSRNSSRDRLICENESKSVRTVRQWLESNTQQAETSPSSIEEQDELGPQIRHGARKSVRFLYGRHALLELLTRFEMERKKEVQSLMHSRPVSTFAHRKRIQALFKGRFLLNQRFVQDERSTSAAASELGLLRQTNTVSDLRKGFLSRVNSHDEAHDERQSDTSSENGMKDQENQLSKDIVNDPDTSSVNGMKCQENQLPYNMVNDSESDGAELLPPTENFEIRDRDQGQEDEGPAEMYQGVHHIETSQQSSELKSQYESDGDELEVEETFDLNPPPTEILEHRDMDQEEGGSVQRNQDAHHVEMSQESLELKSQYESDGVELEGDDTFDHLNPSETDTDVSSWQEEIVEAEEILTNTESIQSLNANSVDNQDEWLYQETVHDGWYDSQPVVTTDSFFTPDGDDDENNNRRELRQLMRRRRVSSLLQSDFRASLDQVLQSYLARQDQASDSDEDWMLEMEHQDPDQHIVGENDEAIESSEPADNWQQQPEISQHTGTEWDIYGLRMDIAMLQERMNSMQSTLETCMKMQLELQQSVKQEVSSALNRSSTFGEESLQDCFLCCDNGFDSSPNRSKPVYVCSNCAGKINWSKLKESVRRP